VIIESKSMEHEGNLDSWFALHGAWYLEHNITKQEIKDYWPWKNGLDKGDVIIIRGLKKGDYKKGDVIVFKIPSQKTPIIHRIVSVNNANEGETIFSTKGDHNDGQLPYEQEIHKEQIVGKAIAQIPKIGWVKLFFVELFR